MDKHPRGYSSQQHSSNRLAAAYGYKIAEGEELASFNAGDPVIILNVNGEPMLVASIDSIDDGGITAGGNYWPADSFSYRRA